MIQITQKYRFWSFIIGLLAIVHSAVGQTDAPEPLSIEAAVLLSLQNNRGLLVEQLEPVIAGAFAQIERGAYDPELYAAVAFSEGSTNETARSTGQQFAVENRDSSGEVGIRQRLPFGTDVEVSVGLDRSISNRAPEQQEARFGLSVTQQLLSGFGAAVNLAAIRQADFETRASVYELKGYTEALVADVEIAYWNYVAAQETIRVFESSLEVAQSQLDAVLDRIEVGDLPENEAAGARAELAQRKQEWIDAKSELNAQRYLFYRMVYPGLPAAHLREVLLVSLEDANVATQPFVISESMELALRMRPELQQTELLLKRDELETVVTRNGRLPKLELFINVGKSGFSDTLRSSFRDTGGPSYDANVGIEFSQALGNRAARGADIIARSTLEQSQIALANLKDLVRYDVLLAHNEYERASAQVEASAETVTYRSQAAKNVQDRFEVGTLTALDVAQAQRDLLEAQINEIQSKVDLLIARVDFYLAEGTLLERRGLSSQGL